MAVAIERSGVALVQRAVGPLAAGGGQPGEQLVRAQRQGPALSLRLVLPCHGAFAYGHTVALTISLTLYAHSSRSLGLVVTFGGHA